MRAGDVLRTVNGEYVVVEQIQHEILESPITVYNFRVADNHTYFVGNTEVGVHNANCAAATNNLINGAKMTTSEALDAAEAFLGKGYKDMGDGRFVSADGTKQVRMTDSDLAPVNNHAGAPHINFEEMIPNPTKPGKMKPDPNKNIHIFLTNP